MHNGLLRKAALPGAGRLLGAAVVHGTEDLSVDEPEGRSPSERVVSAGRVYLTVRLGALICRPPKSKTEPLLEG